MAGLDRAGRGSVTVMPARKRRTSSNRSQNVITLTTFAELDAFISAFATGHINLLILIGERGLAKSRTVRRILGDDVCWIQGNARPFGIYLKLYDFREELVVIDDVDSLHASSDGVRLLKCLCQTEPEKLVAWQSASRQLDREKVPREFVTRSRVVIISNDWKTLNRNVAALQDRGHTLLFEPSAAEVHRKTGEWFTDEEIYNWVGERLHLITDPSMRLYYRAAELKRAGLDWKRLTPLAPDDKRKGLVAELLSDPSFKTQEARAREFVARRGGCRATYFNHARRLKRCGIVPVAGDSPLTRTILDKGR